MELGQDDAEAQLVEIRESDMEMTSSLEDLPEGVVRESMRNLATQCLGSAVRLGTVSKLFFCYYFGEIVSNDELGDSLIEHQQCHKLHKEQNSFKARRNQCCRSVLEGGFWNLLAAALALVGCFVLATITVIYLTKAVRIAEPCWLLVSLVIVLLYCFSLVIVSVILSLGRFCRRREEKILCLVAWVLLMPFVLTICLFIMAAFVNEKIVTEKELGGDAGAYLVAFAAPQSLVSVAMLSEFFAFLAWVRDNPSLSMNSRAASLHVCHIVCETMLIAYLARYFSVAIE
ncbi:hypothetical protein BSKO_06660 [Bryopsis sp. KO-2023]|nr:hypothetical protein BSKO_06660 [Bryopsis sp. KO-2023]